METDLKAEDTNGDGTKESLTGTITHYTNRIVAYSVDKDEVYSLTIKDDGKAAQADAISDVKIENGKAGFNAYDDTKTYSANSNTVFVVVDSADKYDDYDVTVYTGIKNVPDIDAIANKTVSAVALDNKGAVAKVSTSRTATSPAPSR